MHLQNINKFSCFLKKEVNFIAWFFPKLLTPKDVVTWTTETCCFRIPSCNQGVTGSQVLLKPEPYLDLKSYSCFSTRWRPITCFLVKIQRNSRDKVKGNSLQNQKLFLNLLLHFQNINSSLRFSKEKFTFIALILPKLLTPDGCGYLNSLKLLFQNTLRESTC